MSTIGKAAIDIDLSVAFGWHPHFKLMVLFGKSAKLLQHGVILFTGQETEGIRPTQILTLRGVHIDIQRTLEDMGNATIRIGWDWAFALFSYGFINQEHLAKAEVEEVDGATSIKLFNVEFGENTADLIIEDRTDPFYMMGRSA